MMILKDTDMSQIYRNIEITDQIKINEWLSKAPWMKDYLSSELVFENLFAWSNTEDIKILVTDNFMILKCFVYKEVFLPPIAQSKNQFMQAIDFILHTSKNPRIVGLTDSMKGFFMPFNGLLLEDDVLAEYIYEAKDIASYEGRNFHRKKNQLNQFKKLYTYHFASYQNHNEDVKNLLNRYLDQGGSDDDIDAIYNVLNHYQDLNIYVDLLYVEDILVASSVSKKSIFNHGVILFEKADINYHGVYASIAQMTAEKHFQNTLYLTRQEDLGYPQLRKSKMSYQPVKKDMKYVFIADQKLYHIYHLYQERFNDPKPYTDYYFLHHVKMNNLVTYEEKGQLISMVHLLPKQVLFNQQIFHTYLLAGIATQKSFEHQGHMKKVINKTFERLYHEHIPFTYLYPVNQKIYHSLGFVSYTDSIYPSTALYKEVILEQTIDVSFLNSLYETMLKDYEGYVLRDENYWNDYINLLYQDQIHFYLIKIDQKVIGYVAYKDTEIEELILVEPIIPIHKDIDFKAYLHNFEQKEKHMIRIICLKSFLLNYHFPTSLNTHITLKIKDDVLIENSMTFIMHVKDGKATLEDSYFFDYSFSIEEFTEIIFNNEDHPLRVFFPYKPLYTFEKY
jgi:predicted acetyltransferase